MSDGGSIRKGEAYLAVDLGGFVGGRHCVVMVCESVFDEAMNPREEWWRRLYMPSGQRSRQSLHTAPDTKTVHRRHSHVESRSLVILPFMNILKRLFITLRCRLSRPSL